MNIHRHAYNGRGCEYYSEDPILSGYTGSAVVQGAQSKGCLVNIKHAAFNDQEANRSGIAVFMNEQKARELELRNLEQAFPAKGKPAAWVDDPAYDDTYTEGARRALFSVCGGPNMRPCRRFCTGAFFSCRTGRGLSESAFKEQKYISKSVFPVDFCSDKV